jgi:hypothetical protein
VAKSPILGFHVDKRLFTEIPPDGAVLVGFDCGIGKFFDIESVYALRPIYLTANGIKPSVEHGPFADRQIGPKKTIKSRVLKVLRVQAPNGYAVSGMTVRSGLNINGLSLTFMKIKGTALDPKDVMVSAWVGDRTGGSERVIVGEGAPVVGISGSKDDDHIHSLGFIYLDRPPDPIPPAAVPPPPPAVAPQPPPVIPPQEPAAPPINPPPPPQGEGPAGVNPPRPGDPAPPLENPPVEVQAGKPPVAKPAPPGDGEPAAAGDDPGAGPRGAAEKAKTARSGNWLPFAVFGGLMLVFGAGALVFLGSKGRPGPDILAKKKGPVVQGPAQPRKNSGPPKLPTDEPIDLTPHAVNAGVVPPPPEPTVKPGPPPLLTDEPVELVPLVPGPVTAMAPGLPRPQVPSAEAKPPPPPRLAGAVSRGGTVDCRKCHRSVRLEADLPPWCPHCGADLHLAPEDRKPLLLERGDRAGDDLSVPDIRLRRTQPPFFVGRSGRTFRIYILPDRLLFLSAPDIKELSGAENIVLGVSRLGGLLGAAVGGMIAGSMAQQRESRVRLRHDTLDMADVEHLIDMANREGESFELELSDVEEARIEGRNFWQHYFTTDCAARLLLLHGERGQVTIDMPKPDDVRVAMKQLPTVFGEKLVVNAAWDWGKGRYVPKE